MSFWTGSFQASAGRDSLGALEALGAMKGLISMYAWFRIVTGGSHRLRAVEGSFSAILSHAEYEMQSALFFAPRGVSNLH